MSFPATDNGQLIGLELIPDWHRFYLYLFLTYHFNQNEMSHSLTRHVPRNFSEEDTGPFKSKMILTEKKFPLYKIFFSVPSSRLHHSLKGTSVPPFASSGYVNITDWNSSKNKNTLKFNKSRKYIISRDVRNRLSASVPVATTGTVTKCCSYMFYCF
jgi:hypothetical protein